MITAASTHANLGRVEAIARWIVHAVRRAIPWARPCYICTHTRLAPRKPRAVESRGHLHDATIVPLRHTYAEELTVCALPVHRILSTLNTMSTGDQPFHCHRPAWVLEYSGSESGRHNAGGCDRRQRCGCQPQHVRNNMRQTCCVCQAAEVWQTILRSRLAVLDESPNFKYSGEAHTGLIHGSGVLETKDERCDCSFFVHLLFVCWFSLCTRRHGSVYPCARPCRRCRCLHGSS